MRKFDNCEHIEKLDCWKVKPIGELPDLACRKDCERMLKCGHMCRLRCSENCEGTPCKVCEELEERKAQQIEAKAKEDKLKELEIELQALEAKGYAGFLVKEVHPSGDSAEDFYLVRSVTTEMIDSDLLELANKKFLTDASDFMRPCAGKRKSREINTTRLQSSASRHQSGKD